MWGYPRSRRCFYTKWTQSIFNLRAGGVRERKKMKLGEKGIGTNREGIGVNLGGFDQNIYIYEH